MPGCANAPGEIAAATCRSLSEDTVIAIGSYVSFSLQTYRHRRRTVRCTDSQKQSSMHFAVKSNFEPRVTLGWQGLHLRRATKYRLRPYGTYLAAATKRLMSLNPTVPL